MASQTSDQWVFQSPGLRRHAHHRARALRLGNVVFVMLFVAASSLWFLTLRPQSLGGSAAYVMVQGSSMAPTYHSGDLVIVRPAAVYARGDIVAYQIPQGDVGAGLIVIHRIVGGSAATGFSLRGDNNPAPDDWHPMSRDIVGRAWIVIPRAGSLIAFLHDPLPLASLASAIAVALLVFRYQPTTVAERERPSISRRRAAGR